MTQSQVPVADERWRAEIAGRIADGVRFAGLYGTDRDGNCELTVLLGVPGGIDRLSADVTRSATGELSYPTLSALVPAAFWYERALHDLSGVVPIGHPRLDPLLLPVTAGTDRPRPGSTVGTGTTLFEERSGPMDVSGSGIFTLPFGPVRSGVMESIELLIETPGEAIPHLNIRPHYKHRGIAKQFEGQPVDRGVLVAERVEGISSVAHALAYSHAVETIAGSVISPAAQLVRVTFAELERIANHLDVTMRLCDAAGLAVATARFGWHKETVMRIVSSLSGSRFGRGVVVPGGISGSMATQIIRGCTDPALIAGLRALHRKIRSDLSALQDSASFLDRLRGTGLLEHSLAAAHGALGPVGRGSGVDDDDRRSRPRDAYLQLAPAMAQDPPPGVDACDAMARARVRWHEIDVSMRLITDALQTLDSRIDDGPAQVSVTLHDGFAVGWSESAQGEVLYGLEVSGGVIRRCFARSASFHNMVLLHDVFNGDVFTDLPFIEASFGLCYAGVAM